MRKARLITFTTMIVVVLAAVLASAASAAAPEFKPSTATKFTATSGAGTLETLAGFKITCAKDGLTGEITGAKTLKVADIDCEGAKFSGLAAHSPGDKGETILTGEILGLLCYISKANKEVGALLTLVKTLVIEVVGAKIEIKGSIVGRIRPVNTATNTFTVEFTEKGGDAGFNCENEKDELLTKTPTGGVFESSGLGATETLTTNPSTTQIEVTA